MNIRVFDPQSSVSSSQKSSSCVGSSGSSSLISDHEDYENADNILCESLRVSDSSDDSLD